MLPDALIVCLTSQKTRGNSHFSWRLALLFDAKPARLALLFGFKPAFHGACFEAVSVPILSARVPRRASAAFEKERFHY